MPPSESNAPLLPAGLRWAGSPLAHLYGLGVKIHRAASNSRFAPIPTICIGNMTVGGTGKTPATIYVARELVRRGRKPAILMRGYKAQGGDEAEEVKAALSGLNVPILLGSDRYASACRAAKDGCDVVILDDGFQHWRLKRDLDIVLVDATDPFGGDAVLPHGKLREPIEGIQRAGMIVVTRSDILSSAMERDELRRKLDQHSKFKPIFFSTHAPASLRRLGQSLERVSLEMLRGMRAIAACGVGNPGAFERTLKNLGLELIDFKRYEDHHDFSQHEIGELQKMAEGSALIVTEKDAVKIEKLTLRADVPVFALRVAFTLENEKDVWTLLMQRLLVADARVASIPKT